MMPPSRERGLEVLPAFLLIVGHLAPQRGCPGLQRESEAVLHAAGGP